MSQIIDASDRFDSMKRSTEIAARQKERNELLSKVESLTETVAELSARLDALESGTDTEPRAKSTGKRSTK